MISVLGGAGVEKGIPQGEGVEEMDVGEEAVEGVRGEDMEVEAGAGVLGVEGVAGGDEVEKGNEGATRKSQR